MPEHTILRVLVFSIQVFLAQWKLCVATQQCMLAVWHVSAFAGDTYPAKQSLLRCGWATEGEGSQTWYTAPHSNSSVALAAANDPRRTPTFLEAISCLTTGESQEWKNTHCKDNLGPHSHGQLESCYLTGQMRQTGSLGVWFISL